MQTSCRDAVGWSLTRRVLRLAGDQQETFRGGIFFECRESLATGGRIARVHFHLAEGKAGVQLEPKVACIDGFGQRGF